MDRVDDEVAIVFRPRSQDYKRRIQ
jgi:hypothetical protein